MFFKSSTWLVLYCLIFVSESFYLDKSPASILCGLRTVYGFKIIENQFINKNYWNLQKDDLIAYYGYAAETHNIITEDGYILTVFRANSKNSTTQNRKPVIIQHGLLISSDDYCLNPPHQALSEGKQCFSVFLGSLNNQVNSLEIVSSS